MSQQTMCIFWSEIKERLEPTRRHETLHRDILSKHKASFDFALFYDYTVFRNLWEYFSVEFKFMNVSV